MPYVREAVKIIVPYKVGGVTKYREVVIYKMVWHPAKDKVKSSGGGSSGGSSGGGRSGGSGGNTVKAQNASTTETHIPPFVPPVPEPIVVNPLPPGITPPGPGTGSGGVPGAGGSTGPGDIPGTTPGYGGTYPGDSPPSDGGSSGGGDVYVPPVLPPSGGGGGGGSTGGGGSSSTPTQPIQPRPPMSMVYTPPPPTRTPQEIANLVNQGVPPWETLRNSALTTMREQGYTEQGALIDGQVVPWGSFKVTFQDGREFTPQNEDELIIQYASEMERQYRVQGTSYVEQGYTPVIDESGNVSYTRQQQKIDLISGGYVPREGDVQQYPGGPIVNITQPDIWSDARKTIRDFFTGISNAMPDPFGLRPDSSGISPIDRNYMPNLMVLNRNDPAFQSKYNKAMAMGAVPYDQYTGVKLSDIGMGLLSIPQMAYFGWGVKSLTTAVEAFPLVSKFVYGGTRVAGGLFGVGAVKQIVEEPRMDRKIFDIVMLTGQLFGGAVGTGVRLQELSWTNIRSKFPSPSGKKLSYFQETGELRLQNVYDVLGRDVISPFYKYGNIEPGIDFFGPVGFKPELVAYIPSRPSPFSWEIGPRKGNLDILEYGGRGELKLNAPGGSIPRDVFEGMTMEEYGKPVDRYEFPSGMKTEVTKLPGGLEIVEGTNGKFEIVEQKPSSKILELGTIDAPLYWGYGGGGFIQGSNIPSQVAGLPGTRMVPEEWYLTAKSTMPSTPEQADEYLRQALAPKRTLNVDDSLKAIDLEYRLTDDGEFFLNKKDAIDWVKLINNSVTMEKGLPIKTIDFSLLSKDYFMLKKQELEFQSGKLKAIGDKGGLPTSVRPEQGWKLYVQEIPPKANFIERYLRNPEDIYKNAPVSKTSVTPSIFDYLIERYPKVFDETTMFNFPEGVTSKTKISDLVTTARQGQPVNVDKFIDTKMIMEVGPKPINEPYALTSPEMKPFLDEIVRRGFEKDGLRFTLEPKGEPTTTMIEKLSGGSEVVRSSGGTKTFEPSGLFESPDLVGETKPFEPSGLFESPDLNVYFGDTVTLKILNDMEKGIGASDYWKDVKPKISTVTGSKNSPVLLTDVFSVNIQGELPVQAMGGINLNDIMQGRLNISQNIVGIINEQNNDVITDSANINTQIQEQIQSQMQQQQQKMELKQTTEVVDLMESLSSAESDIGFGFGERVTGKGEGIRIPRPILSTEEEFLMQGGLRDSWNVLVRGRQYSHGKKIGDDSFHKAVPHALSFDDAMSMGVNIVGNSSKATFKLEPSTEKPHKLQSSIPSWESEIYKYKQKADNIWVELPSFRIDSPGELKQITMRGGRR